MSQIKLLHSGGNGVSIVAPDSNPASDRTLKLPSDGDSTIDTLSRAGNIIQVVQVLKTDTASLTNTETITDISGLSVTITPASASNKFLITGKVSLAVRQYQNHNIFINVNGSVVGSGTADGNRSTGHGGLGYVSSDSQHMQISVPLDLLVNASDGNAHTIKVQWQAPDTTGNRTIYLNRSQTDNNSDDSGSRYTSTLTVMEVAA